MRECEPRNFVQACLLLLLQERPDHGYELTERLKSLSDGDSDSSGVYRALRGLEQRGMVRSSWSTSTAGPARRTYQLTAAGATALGQHARSLKSTRDVLEGFLLRYEQSTQPGDLVRPNPPPAEAPAERGAPAPLGAFESGGPPGVESVGNGHHHPDQHR